MQVESAPPLELPPHALDATAPEQIYARVFARMRPQAPLLSVRVQYRRYANANAQIRLDKGILMIRMADTLASAPELVLEALAEILLAKLFRQRVPAASNQRYRSYLNQDTLPGDTCLVFTEPILDAWKIDYRLITDPSQIDVIAQHFTACRVAEKPGAALIAEGKA